MEVRDPEHPSIPAALPDEPLPPLRRAAAVRRLEDVHLHPVPAAAAEVPAPAGARVHAVPAQAPRHGGEVGRGTARPYTSTSL